MHPNEYPKEEAALEGTASPLIRLIGAAFLVPGLIAISPPILALFVWIPWQFWTTLAGIILITVGPALLRRAD